MHCLVVEYPAPAEPDRFRQYYEQRHLPLVQELPGLIRAEVAWPQALAPGSQVPFCVFRAVFADAASMQAALMSETGAELASDVPNYSPRGALMYHHAL